MATSLTFTTLIQDLQRYLERGYVSDTTVFDQLPRLINNAEREIAQRLKVLGTIANVTVVGGMSAGASVFIKPDRWRRTVSMNIGTGVSGNVRKEIFPRSYEYCRNYWPDSTAQDVPEFYADYNYYWWLIVPTPVATYPWELNYYQLPPLLDASNQTNWVTDIIPTTLLYGALLQCEPFLKDDARVAVWKTAYEDSLNTVNTEDRERILDRTSTRQET